MLKRLDNRNAAQTFYFKSLLFLIMLLGVLSIRTVTAQRLSAKAAPALEGAPTLRSPKEIETFIRASARKHTLPEEKVVSIAWRESKFKPAVRSKTGKYVGIYQFDLVTWRNTPEGRSGFRREDPVANINAAHWHMKKYGFSAWRVVDRTKRRASGRRRAS